MKKFKYHILGVSCTLMLTFLGSCKKYLDEQPVSAFSTEAAFSNVNTATSTVLGIYARLAGDSGYGIRLSMYYTVDADDFVGPASNTSPDNDRRDIARYQATPQNAQIEAPFENLYTGIERANICIKYIPKMPAYTNGSASDQVLLKRLHGEALTLRAQFYYELMRNWGDVPVQWEPSSDQATLNVPRTDQTVIYERILSDLLTAESLVPWRTEVVRDERITKGAVKGLRARIALARGGYRLNTKTGQVERTADYLKYYQIARDECNDLLQRRDQHTLNSSFQNLFKNYVDAHTLDPTGEIMFEVAMAGGSGVADSKLGYYDGPRSVNGSTSLGNSSITAVPTYFYAFDPNDARRDVTICPYFFNFDGTKTLQRLIGLPSGKFRRDWITNPAIPVNSAAQYFGINWPILRFADVLLMFAEADNEISGGPSAAAIAALREVRLRGFNGDATKIGTIPTDKAGFFTAINNERLFEFGGEGLRKFDLIRWNLFNSTLTDTRNNLTAMFNKQAPYNNLPQTMTYQNAQPTINYGSSLYAPSPSTVPSGYTRVNWVSSLTAVYNSSVAQYFKPNSREVLPIPQPSIDANPMLTQNPGY
ncbi:RagB/SusD family nutrient uptake outer membrane protein [Mucilaginibacter daejeonensis]|uniref:RagB/SusD family nutrient uptake outer membrane protein n=1 Tax=Mucilaginibacter daejeonensis TaxID=398049 RepID=UPI001D17418A|nr:RagB/SusD family nutrient uptake outer membrane protein [Mucilaginibacter daejeonensis]UEG54817.1 RagB/SusD family nutrient uptake outer membrane protein [Mucilaginibacter daejeonensis]